MLPLLKSDGSRGALTWFWLSRSKRYSRHNWHYVACFNAIVTPFDSCIFFRWPLSPRPTAETTRGRGEGSEEVLTPARWRFLLGGQQKKFLSNPRGKEKVRFLRLT